MAFEVNSLENITIPNSVTIIGAWAFSDCKNLSNITIPKSVTEIGNYAFGYYDGKIIEGFKIYCYKDTAGHRYAIDNGFDYELLNDAPAAQVVLQFAPADLCADLLSNIASEQRAKVVYEYLYRQIEDKKVRETIDFLLNREEAHNAMFWEAFNKVQRTGSNRDFGTTKAAKMYFSMSEPSPSDTPFPSAPVDPPSFDN